ncbi:tyrosine-type recombinase/integrase [Neptuniibacter pectenicola]|uniref:Tyrosine-type recombinase/integrase n=1 Tax=Neptuniibacter pectenicola TaxID=1806669 RepID=A0ABU9TW57_9GAMM
MTSQIIDRHKVLVCLLNTFLEGKTIDHLRPDQWQEAYSLLSYFPKGVNKDNFTAHFPNIKQGFSDTTPPSNSLSKNTLGTAQSRLKRMCQFASGQDWIIKDYLSIKRPAKPSKGEKKNKYVQLAENDIAKLLKGYLYDYVKNAPDYRDAHHSWQFWFLPIALYTGMRRTEIAQLHASDVKYDDENKVWYIHVNDEESRKNKTDASDRLIPIHKQLSDCGFLKFVAERHNDEFPVLFPHLWFFHAGRNKGKKRPTVNADIIGDWFIRKDSERVKKSNGTEGNYFFDVGLNEDKKVLHSTRHTFVGPLRKQGVTDIAMANVVGHENGLMTEHYGKEQSIRDNLAVISKLDYGDAGNLSHLNFNLFRDNLTDKKKQPRIKARARPKRKKVG